MPYEIGELGDTCIDDIGITDLEKLARLLVGYRLLDGRRLHLLLLFAAVKCLLGRHAIEKV